MIAVTTSPFAARVMRVGRVIREVPRVFTLHLDPGEPFSFSPGQFNMLYLYGVGEVPISISGDPANPRTLVHTIRRAGSVTAPMESLRAGAHLGVRGPYGTPWPLAEARGRDVVVIAGGIGLAPVRPLILELLQRRREVGRLAILFGARTPDDLLYRKELEAWRGRFDVQVEVTVDRAGPGWRGNVGAVTALLPAARIDPVDSVAMVCGPEVMIRFTVRELARKGLTPDRIFVSLERNMKCAVGSCGHCQLGPFFVCRDGPVFPFSQVAPFFRVREL